MANSANDARIVMTLDAGGTNFCFSKRCAQFRCDSATLSVLESSLLALSWGVGRF